MALSIRKQDMVIQPRGLVYLFLFLALLVLAQSTAGGNMKMAILVIILPIATLFLLAGAQYPMLSFSLYVFTCCYFHAIYRYAEIKGLSVIIPICLIVCVLSIIMNKASRSKTLTIQWKNTFNVLSVGNLFWTLVILLEKFAPYTETGDFATNFGVFWAGPISILLCGLLLDTPKKLRLTLILLGIFVCTAAMKLYWQKTHGWDKVELKFLLEGENWHTHILNDGTVRYFSFFSDAGSFGGTMGALFMVFIVCGFVLRRLWFRWFCFGVALLAGLGLVMSGTRGAIVIPFVGIAMFVILSKNATAIVSSLVVGSLAFCFFYFTDIGNENSFIRRVRTAFRPTEDASFNVRVDNQKRIAYYLADKPFGVGSGGHIVDTKQLMEMDEKFIPTDSYWVDIWVQYGIVGLCFYLTYFSIVILRCCYVLLFKIRHKELRLILSGIVGAVCGLLVNAYVGRTIGFYPTSLLAPLLLSFVLNGPYIDKQLPPDYKL